MNENNMEAMETSLEATGTNETTPETDPDDWDNIDLSDVSDDSVPTPEPSQEEPQPEADQQEEGPEQEAEPETKEAPEEPQEAADQQLFDLKHMGQSYQVNRDQVVTLAQKGMDYDHVRTERDIAREKYAELEGFLQELAAPSGMSIEDLIDNTRASVLADREGIDQTVALQRVKLDRDRRAFEAQQQKAQQSQQVQDQENQRVQQSFLRFSKEYESVDPKDIPKEVWDAFGQGMDLTDAYAHWENRQLRQELQETREKLETATQNEKNKERSTGSQQSAGVGETQKRDPIDEDWYSGD